MKNYFLHMKKFTILFNLLLACCLSVVSYAQQAATATWQLTSTTLRTVTTTGVVAAASEATGPVFPSPTYNSRTIAGTTTSVSTQNITVNPNSTGTSSTTAHTNGGYAQFAVSPADGSEFTVSSISFYMGSAGANSNGTSIEYALNSSFSSPVVLATPTGSVDFPLRDLLYPFSYSPSGITVHSGDTLFLRIYTWNASTSARQLLLSNMVISGTVVAIRPTVATAAATNITYNAANVGGNVVSDAGNAVTERGVVYSINANPTTADGKVIDPSGGTGPFSVLLSGLSEYTLYHFRAYATNSLGTSYGQDLTFGTPSAPDAVVVAPKQMENLGRALVAVRRSSDEVYVGWRMLGTDPTSITFNLYRDGVKLNNTPIATTTNYVDTTTTNGVYMIKPVIDNVEQAASEQAAVWAKNYLDIPLQVPAGGITPDGVAYTYTANDASVGDVDGDGEYEIILKWEPTRKNDNAGDYSGKTILDCYKLNGTKLWRIDLGININAGPHFTQFLVYDFDGDGKAEVACKTADGTVDGQGVVIGNPTVDYRNSDGWVDSGPEFLTVFNGFTGAAMATINYEPARGSYSDWGDNYGNRAERYVSAVAYLDGARPSLIIGRGYYNKLVRAAYDWRDGQLTLRWKFDSNDNTSPLNASYKAQGNHQMTIGDVDGDGKQEVFNGASAINDNGRGLWSNGLGHGDALHMSDMDPDRPGLEIWQPYEAPAFNGNIGAALVDAKTGVPIFTVAESSADVGRAMAADIDPRYKGYELWAARGNIYNCKGETISTGVKPPMNFGIWWDGDLCRELLDNFSVWKYDYTTGVTNRFYQPSGVSSNNSTKATPALTADLFGDWREEMMFRTTNDDTLRIFTTTIPTEHRIYTLMHDPQYRVAIAWQNSGYNQPPHPSFYLGDSMAEAPRPNIKVKDILPPKVSQISRGLPDSAVTTAESFKYRVSFNENVSGVDTSDFILTSTGGLSGVISSVIPVDGAVYDVDVVGISGEGTLRLDLKGSGTQIADTSGNMIAAGFTNGEIYTRVKVAQVVLMDTIYAKRIGDGDFMLGAAASSGLKLTYSSSNPEVAYVDSTGSVHITGVGSTVVSAIQDGDNIFAAAMTSRVFIVQPFNITVLHQDGDAGNIGNNTIRPYLKLMNADSSVVALSELTVRYWLTAENYTGLTTLIDWAQLGNNKVKVNYVPLSLPRKGAFGYVEYRFDASAGLLARGGSSGPIQSRLYNSDWSVLDESDDRSYKPTSVYSLNEKITLYRNGKLIWGAEPETDSATIKLKAYSERKGGAANTISSYIKITNEGNMPVDFGDISVRYWFTADGNASLNYWVDYAKLGGNNFLGQFVRINPVLDKADAYFEIKPKSSLGTLHPSSNTGNIQYRIAKADWSPFLQANDHSYNASSIFALNNKITIYYKGTLVWGDEPNAAQQLTMAAPQVAGLVMASKDLILYPNPVSDQLNIRLGEVGPGAVLTVRSVNGDVVRQIKLDRGNKSISMKGLPAGTYFATIATSGELKTIKVVKM
jgi:hypothetical protein